MSNCIGIAPEQVCYVHCNFSNTVLAIPKLIIAMDFSLNFNFYYFLSLCYIFICSSKRSMQQPLQLRHCEMRSLHQSAARKHVCHASAPEKRQRIPSSYNQFIKEEIQRIKASNPEISHREAFSTAAKNWAHFPHIHFGLMLESNKKYKFDEGGSNLLRTKAAVCNK